MFENHSKFSDDRLLTLVRTCARTVRLWCEERDNMVPFPSGDLNGYCAIASAQLWREFRDYGIKAQICMAESDNGSHVYCLVSDYVVDITATQFEEFRNSPLNILHKKEADAYWFYRDDQVFNTDQELIKYQRKTKWESAQVAWA